MNNYFDIVFLMAFLLLFGREDWLPHKNVFTYKKTDHSKIIFVKQNKMTI